MENQDSQKKQDLSNLAMGDSSCTKTSTSLGTNIPVGQSSATIAPPPPAARLFSHNPLPSSSAADSNLAMDISSCTNTSSSLGTSIPVGHTSSTVAPPPPAARLFGQNLVVAPPPRAARLFGQNLLPSSSAADSNLAMGIPVGQSGSTVVPPPPAAHLLGSSSSTDGLDISMGQSVIVAAASTSLGFDRWLGQPINPPVVTPGSQVASSSKAKALNFQMTKISIGDWTKTATSSTDLVAKCSFLKKKFMWEIMDEVQTETGTSKQLKKMEIPWDHVLSLRGNNETGCLEIELSERPTFMAGGGPLLTEKWKPVNHFAPNHPSSMCRRHALYFEPGVLKTNYSKIIADSFWSRTLQVPFPSLPLTLFFEGNLMVRDNSQNATANQLLGTQGTSQVASSSKAKALNFQMTKISIGDWTKTATSSTDLVAKCSFLKKKFMWEIMDEVQTETGTRKELKRMEIPWDHVLSLRGNNETGCLEIELSERPTFMADGDLLAEKWKPINEFAPDHPSSTCRRHALYFEPGVLKTNYSKIIADSFWSRTLQVPFPSLPGSLFFDGGQGNLPVRDNSQNATANQLLGTQGTSQQNPQEDAKRGEKRKDFS